VVNNTGVIQAQTVESRNGTISCCRMQAGRERGRHTGRFGTGAGRPRQRHGDGYHVGLFGGTSMPPATRRRTVLVGGGYRARTLTFRCTATYMSADATISADAITNGNGGTACAVADDSTRAYGSITARGGAQGGAGG